MASLHEIQQELNGALDALREKAPNLTRLFELLREEQEQLNLLRPSYTPPGTWTPDWTYRPPTTFPTLYPHIWNTNAAAPFTASPHYAFLMGSSELEIIPPVWPPDPLPEASDDEMGEDKGDGEERASNGDTSPSGA